MFYLLDMGQVEQNIARQAMREGSELPDRIKNAPELSEGLELYLDAFFDLDTERNHGNGIQRIPITKVYKYAQMFNFDETQTEDLLYFINEMDRAHTSKLSEQLETLKRNSK